MKAWRNDARAKVTGRAKYTDDLKMHNMLHCVPVYTNRFIHGKMFGLTGLVSAREVEGVVRVITAEDVPGVLEYGQIQKDYPVLARDRIRCEGDVIALVAAETRDAALKAAAMIDVDGEELPALFSPSEALEDTAVLIHPGKGSNIINTHRIRRGKDIDEALSECDEVLTRSFSTGFVEHAYMEPESALCFLRGDGVMEVHGSMQHPFSTRRFIAAFLGKPLSGIEIVGTPMGGGFGGKDDTAAIVCARAALAAQICSRPVKLTYDREWSIRESYKRHPYEMAYTVGIKDGRIHAVKADMTADGGAYASVTPWVTWRSTVQCCGPYQVDHVHCDVRGVHTNNVFTGAFRGFGAPQVNFAVEQLVEECAAACGIDSTEFRRRNMVCQDCETVTSQKLDNHVVSLEAVMDKALEISGYREKIKKCTFGKGKVNGKERSGDREYGIGMAVSYRGASLGAEGMDFCSAIINCQFDGSIILEVGIHENGQGAESAMVLLLAKELGVKKERIRYNRSSTSHIPDGGTTVASRGTLMGGGAVVNGVKNLKKVIAESLHKDLGCSPEDVLFKDDGVSSSDGTFLTWEEAMHRMFLNTDYPYAFGTFQAPKVSWDEETGKGNAYFTWVYSCQIAEVEVDTKTGKIQLVGAYAVHDSGKTVNRPMIEGQVHGGFAQGYGMAVKENLKIEKGRVQTANLNKYRIPRSTDCADMVVEFIENPDPNSPSGAKGIGEPALEIAAAAVANAVYYATGQRHYAYPIIIGGR